MTGHRPAQRAPRPPLAFSMSLGVLKTRGTPTRGAEPTPPEPLPLPFYTLPEHPRGDPWMTTTSSGS